MTYSDNKSQRLSQIEALLLDHPEGLTQANLARRLGVHRSTIHRNLADLSVPVYEDDGRIVIDRDAYLVNLRLNLHEILFIHLAGRLMTTHMDRQNPHAAAALRKLGIALETLAPQISRFVRGSANTFDNETKRQDSHYLQVLEKLTIAWAGNHKTHLWYRSHKSGPIKEYIFRPYFIEVGAFGQSLYSIGRIDLDSTYRTFKIERVERIELLNDKFSIPDDFDPETLLGQAWGIWFTDQEPIEIVLKFSPNVASRVRETRWHPTEQVYLQEDGSLLWRAWIAEPREMMPWVRGWGCDCEVIEPMDMREKMKEEASKLFALYAGENK